MNKKTKILYVVGSYVDNELQYEYEFDVYMKARMWYDENKNNFEDLRLYKYTTIKERII